MTVGCRSPAWHQRYKMATRGCLLLSQNLKLVPCGHTLTLPVQGTALGRTSGLAVGLGTGLCPGDWC